MNIAAPTRSDASARAGRGLIEVATVAGRPTVTRMRASSPLKLLAPRAPGRCASIFVSTFGGGLVTGDRIDLRVRTTAALCWLGTQASTKVYKSVNGVGCTQSLHASVGDGAILLSLPDPVTCFARARYEQRQQFEIECGGAVVMLDWFTGGRVARRERWQFDRYRSRTDVHYAGDHVFADAVLLDAHRGPIDAKFRVGGFDCFATLVLVGPPVALAAEQIVSAIRQERLTREAPLLATASPIREGAVVRIAGPGPEPVAHYVRRHLSALTAELLGGDDPTRRKW